MKLSQIDIEKIANYVSSWWAARLQKGDMEAFQRFLHDAIVTQLARNPERPYLRLECDYDPQGPLLDAVRAAGVECRGVLFSAEGILPGKHSTGIFPARDDDPEFDVLAAPSRLVVKEGYGNWRDPIPLDDIISGRAPGARR